MIYGDAIFNETLVQIIRKDYRHPFYAEAVELAQEMSVHVYGRKPVELLERARPGEDQAITDYRLENFEPTTKAPCGKAIKIVSKIFNPNLSSIIFRKKDEGAAELEEYTKYYYPVYNSLTVYNKDVTLKKMIADPNALMAVKPLRIPKDDTEKVRHPIAIIYDSERVWNWDFDHYLVNIAIEKITGGDKYTFDYYDYKDYIRFTAIVMVKDVDKLTLQILSRYTHNFKDKNGDEQIPAWKLRGNTLKTSEGEVLYESFFADAKAHWNLSLIHESDVLGSFIKHMNPQRYVVGTECTHQEIIDGISCRCYGGYLQGASGVAGKGVKTKCSMCNGSGKVASSPYENHIILKQKLDEMSNVSLDPVGYVKVPVDATKLLAERADQMSQRGNAAINMGIEDFVGANQSGIAKLYDRSAQSDTIYDVGVIMYDVHFQNQYYFMNLYMNSVADRSANKDTDNNLPTVNKPTKFNVQSIGELIESFRNANDAGLDRNYKQSKEIEILTRDLDTNTELKEYYMAIIGLDPLYGMTQDAIDLDLMKGLIYKNDAVVHANLSPFVDRAIAENAGFLKIDKREQIVVLRAFADELLAATKPTLDVNFDTPPPNEPE